MNKQVGLFTVLAVTILVSLLNYDAELVARLAEEGALTLDAVVIAFLLLIGYSLMVEELQRQELID